MLVLDGGHPIGVVTRSDVLSFLAARAMTAPGSRRGPADYERREPRPRLRDAGDPRGPGARSDHRRGRPADQPRDDVRPGRGGQAPGLRVRAQRQPDAQRARDVPRVARRRGARARVRERPGRRGRDLPDAVARRPRDPAERHVRRDVPARRRASTNVSASTGPPSISATSMQSPTRGPTRPGWSGSRRRPIPRSTSSTSTPSRSSRTPATRGSSSTTPSRRRTSSSRSRSARTRSCTRSTKYLGGHSDVVGGFVATHDAEFADELRFLQNAMGAVPSPFDCYLVLRGVRTLGIRMDRHCANARAIVDVLREHDAVARTFYPGLPDHPGHDIAARQMRDFGGMVSLHPRGRREQRARRGRQDAAVHPRRVARRRRVVDRAPGAHDARVGDGFAARSRSRARALSVGIETTEDLVDDLQQALDALVW